MSRVKPNKEQAIRTDNGQPPERGTEVNQRNQNPFENDYYSNHFSALDDIEIEFSYFNNFQIFNRDQVYVLSDAQQSDYLHMDGIYIDAFNRKFGNLYTLANRPINIRLPETTRFYADIDPCSDININTDECVVFDNNFS